MSARWSSRSASRSSSAGRDMGECHQARTKEKSHEDRLSKHQKFPLGRALAALESGECLQSLSRGRQLLFLNAALLLLLLQRLFGFRALLLVPFRHLLVLFRFLRRLLQLPACPTTESDLLG